MKKFICILLFPLILWSQEKLKKDLDNDGIPDSVYIDYEELTIVCLLSTQNFEKIVSEPIEMTEPSAGIRETKNGFEFFNNWMRAGYAAQFRYEPKNQKVRLIGMSRYEFGNAANDGSGESSVNLLTNDYIGNWNYYDHSKNKLTKIPAIKIKMKFDPIYLNNFSEENYFNYADQCSELYYKHRKSITKE